VMRRPSDVGPRGASEPGPTVFPYPPGRFLVERKRRTPPAFHTIQPGIGRCQRKGSFVHPWFVRAEGEVVVFPSERVEARARFDDFFEEENERLFKALYFVTGNRHDAEELMQDAFVKLWERWAEIDRISDPVGYLFRVALNGFRMRRRRAAMAIRKVLPAVEGRDEFLDAEMRADVRRLLLEVTPRQRAALLLVDLLGYPSEEAARILRVRPSTVRALATKGRRALRDMEGARDA
jgi:RNA polymerase sigma factor (sigma-70 family)